MDMLKDVTAKNDPNMPMYETHVKPRLALGKNGWVAWQDAWKIGFEQFHDQYAYVLSMVNSSGN